MIQGTKCTQCSANCATCLVLPSNCSMCMPGFKFSDGTLNCVTGCPTGTYNSSGSCLPCNESCYGCSGPASTQCTSCNGTQGYVAATNTCVATCPSSSYFSNNTCIPCATKCNTCAASDSNCTSCSAPALYQPFNLVGPTPGDCGNSCRSGFYGDKSSVCQGKTPTTEFSFNLTP